MRLERSKSLILYRQKTNVHHMMIFINQFEFAVKHTFKMTANMLEYDRHKIAKSLINYKVVARLKIVTV